MFIHFALRLAIFELFHIPRYSFDSHAKFQIDIYTGIYFLFAKLPNCQEKQ